MFGPPPMFYDPEQAVPPQDSASYQQWVDSYAQGGHQQLNYSAFAGGNIAHIQFPDQAQSQQHHQHAAMQEMSAGMMQQPDRKSVV